MAVDISSSSSSDCGGLGALEAKRCDVIGNVAILDEEGRDSMRRDII